MKIAILDGSPEAGALSSYVGELKSDLSNRDHDVEVLTLRDLNLKYCTGCWSCWWGPTCGECVLKDDTAQILTAVINSDLVIMASPVIMGFISALLKKAQDKIPALLLPYIRIIDGECRHLKRYDNYPRWGLLLEKSADTDDEDIEIIRSIQGHAANNLRSELCFDACVTDPPKEVADEIDSL